MKNVLVRIQEYSSIASSTERVILSFIRNNMKEVMDMNTKLLSEKTFSSPATIIRLCRKLGFSGYKELQRSLIYEIALSAEQSQTFDNNITANDSTEMVIDKVAYNSIVSIENTRKLFDASIIDECVDLISQASTIFLFGIGSSLLVARDAYLKFLRVNKRVMLSDDWHAQLLQAKNISRNDLAIIISYSGLTKEMITCAEAVRDKGAPILSISRFEETPLSKLSDYVLSVSTQEQIFRSGAMASRIAQLSVIDVLYMVYVHRNEEYKEQFRRTHIDKTDAFETEGKEE